MKDKLVIFLLKIKKFVIKNKIAVGIGVLLLITSLIVYKIVFAAEDYTDKISVSDLEIVENGISTGTAPFDLEEGTGNDTTANDEIVRTFDTFDINLSYKTTLNGTVENGTTLQLQREIVFVVEFPADYITSTDNLGAINIRPIMLNGDMSYTLAKIHDGTINQFTIRVLSDISYAADENPTSTETQILKFMVGGTQNGADITPESIEVYESTKSQNATSDIIDGISNGQIVTTAEVNVEAKLVSSYAFKRNGTGDRIVPFGILVKLVEDETKGIKGVTYPLDFNIRVAATRTGGEGEIPGNTKITYIESSANTYHADTDLFNIPNYIIDEEDGYDSSLAAYDSGDITENGQVFTISGIQSNGMFPKIYDTEENIIGTYYGEFLSERADGDIDNYDIEISADDNDEEETGVVINGSSVTINDAFVANGYDGEGENASTITSITLKDEDNAKEVLSIYNKEIVTMNISSTYGKSGDTITSAKIQQAVVIPEEITLIPYETNVGDEGYFTFDTNKSSILKEDFNVTIYSSIDEIAGEEDTIYSSFEEFLAATKPTESLYNIVVFEMYDDAEIEPDTDVSFYLKGRLDRIVEESTTYGFETYFDIKDNSTLLFTNIGENNVVEKEILDEQVIDYTEFKARTDLELKDSEGNTDFSSSYSEALTWAISPTVRSNAEILNAANLNLDDITIYVYISPGLNYTENSQYLEPSDSELIQEGEYDGYTKLTYSLLGYKTNDYIDEIYLDTYINLNAEATQKVVVVINAKTEDNTLDSSSASERTTSKEIYIFGSSAVMFRQVAVTPVVTYSDSMDINYKTEVFNGTESNIASLLTINILPYSGDSNSDYDGSYFMDSVVPEGAYCNNSAAATIIANIDTYGNWYACADNSTEDEKKLVTAIRVDKTLDAGASTNISFTLNADDAENGDVFSTTAYVKYKYEGEEEYETPYEVTNSAEAEIVAIRLTGKVWEDFSYDGERDENERELEDIVLKLYDSDDTLIDETTTDSDGNYSFNGLEVAKSYYVKATYDKEKYFPTKANETVLPTYKSVFTSETEGEEVFALSPEYTVEETTTSINNINLGLALKKTFALSINKYITRVVVQSAFAADKVYEFDKVKSAKIDVKDMSKVTIKVVYTLELENVKYYPGYAMEVVDYAPSGMAFNEEYSENAGWELDDNGFLVNRTLSEELISGGEKKYLTIAFYITSEEAGEFVNSASIYDLQPLVLGTDE